MKKACSEPCRLIALKMKLAVVHAFCIFVISYPSFSGSLSAVRFRGGRLKSLGCRGSPTGKSIVDDLRKRSDEENACTAKSNSPTASDATATVTDATTTVTDATTTVTDATTTVTDATVTDAYIYVDIIFLLDGSSSVGIDNFELLRQWTINQTLAIYRKFGSSAQVGVVQYSHKPLEYLGIPITSPDYFEIPLILGECHDNDTCVIDRISNMKYIGKTTYTYYGLRRVAEVEFPRSSRYPEAKRIVVVVTDGEADDYASLKLGYDEYCRTGYITPFAVGIVNKNSQRFEDTLKTIANCGTGDSRVYYVDSYEELRGFSQLVNNITTIATQDSVNGTSTEGSDD